MSLKVRIFVATSLLVALVAVVAGGFSLLREANHQRELLDLRARQIETSWSDLIAIASAKTTVLVERNLNLESTVNAIVTRDEAMLRSLRDYIGQIATESPNFIRLDIYTLGGELIESTDAEFFTESVAGMATDIPVGEGMALSGVDIRQSQLVGVEAIPIRREDQAIATAIVSTDLNPALEILAKRLDAEIVVLDRDDKAQGRMPTGIDPNLWRQQLLDNSADAIHQQGGRDLAVNLLDLIGPGLGRVGRLVVVQDIGDEAEARQLEQLAMLLSAVIACLVPLFCLWLYLRSALRPLDEGITTLTQLSAGRTDHYFEIDLNRTDEIASVGHAIAVFRDNVRQIERSADREDRRRQRQARFIRKQILALTETLDEEARKTALEDLRDLQAEGTVHGRDETASDELGVIGIALSRMTTRVSNQQTELNKLVRELREALELKTQLISLQRELDIARRLQLSVLPKEFPALDGYDIAACMHPAKEVGGDFYDIFEIEPGRLAFIVGDVSGKGVPAAFFMLIARTLFKALALNGGGPEATLTRLNALLSAENDELMFVTVFYAELETATGKLEFCNAGHNPPLLMAGDGEVRELEAPGNPALAMLDDWQFEAGRCLLAAGDRLTLYTDGVTEAMNEAKELFDESRLEAAIVERRTANCEAVLSSIVEEVEAFAGDEPQSDDITLVLLHAI